MTPAESVDQGPLKAAVCGSALLHAVWPGDLPAIQEGAGVEPPASTARGAVETESSPVREPHDVAATEAQRPKVVMARDVEKRARREGMVRTTSSGSVG